MENSWEQFIAAYQSAKPGMQGFIDSDEISKFVDKLTSEIQPTERIKHRLVILTSNYCLGIISKDELIKVATEITSSKRDAEKATQDIETFFESQKTNIENNVYVVEQKSDVDAALSKPKYEDDVPPVTQTVPVAAPQATPTPTPTTLTIDNLRNQAVSMWSQYLATTDAGQQQGYKNAIASLAASAAEIAPNPATPTDDLATLWQTIHANNRAALPEIDESARTRITDTYTKPTSEGEAPANIISAIKGTADS